MFGWPHRLGGDEFEQAPGVGDGQGSLACCSPWSHKESDTTERLNGTELKTESLTILRVERRTLGLPGGSVVKNPPAHARAMGSVPGRGRSHMPRSN